MNEEILLTITMLVSNREDTIGKCLKSIKHLLDTVPSELIVVDTAGNQACMDIVLQYTDNIVEFEWCNDFAAARNAGVKKARGQWLMILDDDEWFESTDNLENFFLSGEYHKYNSAAYIQRNYHNKVGTKWRDADVTRLAKREKGTRFYGKIHEYITPLRQPVYFADDYVHHYGYMYDSTQKVFEHSWRNIKPLLEMHRENKSDYHTVAQLIQEYWNVKEYFSLIELSKELRRNSTSWNSLEKAKNTTYAVVSEMRAYLAQQRYGDGYEVGKELLERRDIPILARGSLCSQMADICFRLEKYDETLEYIEKYAAALKEWETLTESERRFKNLFGTAERYMLQETLDRFSLLRLHIYVLQENWAEAGEQLLAFDWNNKGQKLLENTPKDIVSALKKVPFDRQYLAVLKTFEDNITFLSIVYTEFEQSDTDEQTLLMAYLRFLPLKGVKMCRCHLIYAGTQNDISLAVAALEALGEQNLPFFLKDAAYWDSLYKLDIDINSYMTSLSGYEWMETARKLWEQIPMDVCETAYLCLIRGLEKTDLRYTFISALMMEKRLFASTEPEQEERETAFEAEDAETSTQPEIAEDEEETTLEAEDENTMTSSQDAEPTAKETQPAWMSMAPDEIWDKLNQLSQYWVTCAATLYREEVFVSDLFKNLPPAYQFGWYIMQANAVKKDNPSLFARKVADAAKAYPALKEPCIKVLREIPSLRGGSSSIKETGY